MARKGLDFAAVRAIALALPEVEEVASARGRGFKLRGKLLACQAIHSSAEDESWVVHIDTSVRAQLLAAEPDVYYVTPHYEPYAAVLVRLARIGRPALRKLLGTAWAFVAAKAPARSAKREGKKTKKRR
jgi:hypothetical protein